MEKKQFKAESQRLMELMIGSIYTHREIFLREIVSNASDAIDKLAYRALTDDKVGMDREDFSIVIVPDKDAGTLTFRPSESVNRTIGSAAVSDGFAAQPESIPTSSASARRQAKKRFTSMVILHKI